MSQLTIDNQLNFFGEKLHQNGFTIIGTKTKKPVWFDCFKDGYFFHITKMDNEFEGFSIGINNIPSRENGTGTQLETGSNVLTIEKMNACLLRAPYHFDSTRYNPRRKIPRNYKDVLDFCKMAGRTLSNYVFNPDVKKTSDAVFQISTMTIRSKPENYMLAKMDETDYAANPQINGEIMAASFKMLNSIKYLQEVAELNPSNLDKLVIGECAKILQKLPY
jgi:hypothetical protein